MRSISIVSQLKLRRAATALSLAGIFCAGLFLSFRLAGSDDDSDPWVPITDTEAVTFGQLSPLLSNSVSGWQTGAVFVDYQELAQDGITSGYIQVVEFDPSQPSGEGVQVVQDFPVLNPSLSASSSEMYSFATPTAGPQASTLVAVGYTNSDHPTPYWQSLAAKPKVQKIVHPLAQSGLLIGGLTVSDLPAPPALNQIKPIYNGNNDPAGILPFTSMDSVPQLINQCATAAVSNSLQYLIKNDDNSANNPSWENPSRVAVLDRLSGRNVPVNGALPSLSAMYGKLKYLAAILNGKVTVSHMGCFSLTGSISKGCVPGDITVTVGNMTATSTAVINAATKKPWPVTPQFITDSLDAKKDVELCFGFYINGSTAGHCVHVVGYRVGTEYNQTVGLPAGNYLELDVIQDAAQSDDPMAPHAVGAGTLGHTKLVVGMDANKRLWITNFPAGPALVMQAVAEAKN